VWRGARSSLSKAPRQTLLTIPLSRVLVRLRKGRGEVRAEWQDAHETLTLLHRAAATQAGSRWQCARCENAWGGEGVSGIPGLTGLRCRCRRHRTGPRPGTVWDGIGRV